MSVLKLEAEDFVGRGRSLPPGDYMVTVEDAKLEEVDADRERLTRRYGNIRTRDGAVEIPPVNGGAPFRIGNRKLFARSWTKHTNEQAQSIGQREIKHEAVSAGMVQKPSKGESIELDVNEAYASELVGKEVLVRTKLRTVYKHAQTGVIVKTPTPEQLASAEVVGEEQPEISAWLQP